MSPTPKVDRKLAEDFKTAFKGKVGDEVIASVGAKLSSAALTSYPANGSIASIVIWMKCQCTVKNGGKTFNGNSWGIAFPGGGALIGDVYTDDINALYANTVSFALTATPVYTAFYFFDKNHNSLGSFQAGSVSTVGGTGGGSGSWS
jgi:hypothetical protein